MFPYESRWGWLTRTGYLHLAEAIAEKSHAFQQPYQSVLERRAQGIRVALKVRLVVIVLLNLGILMSVLASAAQVFPALGEAQGLLAPVAGLVSGIVVVALTMMYFLIARYLGQLQADIIACLALGTPCMPELPDGEKDEVREVERRAQEDSWALSFPPGHGRAE